MKQKNAILIIDGQFDFCDPKGSLYVGGAEDDMKRVGDFITKNESNLDFIGLTMDSHQVIDISHPSFWINKDGKNPDPFTIITTSDVMTGVWTPRFAPNAAIRYIEELEKQGEFPHCIWPEHCIIGTKGASFVDSIMIPIQSWCRNTNSFYQVVTKGTYPVTEHFGAFRANIPVEGKAETQLNFGLIKKLEEFDNIYFAGEASSHCVSTTLKQAMEFPELAKKFIILTDCMSPVTGFEHIADSIYEDAKKIGVRFEKSTDITFK